MENIKNILENIKNGDGYQVQGGKINYYKDRFYLSTFATETKISKLKATQLIKETINK